MWLGLFAGSVARMSFLKTLGYQICFAERIVLLLFVAESGGWTRAAGPTRKEKMGCLDEHEGGIDYQ